MPDFDRTDFSLLHRPRGVFLALLFAPLWACSGEPGPDAMIGPEGGVAAPAAAAFTEGTAQVVIEEEPGAEPGVWRYRVRIIGAETAGLAAYQGRVILPARGVELHEVTTPTRDGEYRLVNTDAFTQGVIRFAAFAVEPFESDEAFTFVVKAPIPMRPDAIRARLEVAGEADAREFRADALLPSNGLYRADGTPVVR